VQRTADKLVPLKKQSSTSRTAARSVSAASQIRRAQVIHPALARHLAQNAPKTKIGLFSGASLSEEVENPIASFVGKRGPYMSSSASRKLIHAAKWTLRMCISRFRAQPHLRFLRRSGPGSGRGFAHPPGRERNSLVFRGISAEALSMAKKIVLEVNPAIPDYTGFHDIALPAVLRAWVGRFRS